MPAYGTSRTARTAVLPYDGVMRHPLTECHTGLPEMDCPLITSEHSSRISREESHDFNRGRSQCIKYISDSIGCNNFWLLYIHICLWHVFHKIRQWHSIYDTHVLCGGISCINGKG